LLKKLDLGSAPDAKLKQSGQVIFEEFGGAPHSSYTGVELKDDLTVSLLQARLIELNLPINVVVGRLEDICAAVSTLDRPTQRVRWSRPTSRRHRTPIVPSGS
jgi:hypothetical protein